LRKGDAIAPLLFNIALKIAIRRSNREKWGNIFGKRSLIMAFDDNMLIMARRLQDVEEVFRSSSSSFSILSDDRFKASSKTIPPHSAI